MEKTESIWMIRSGSRGRMGLCNLAGNQIAPFTFDWSISGFCWASCSIGDQLFIVDSRGSIVRQVDGVECYSSLSDGMISVTDILTEKDGYVSIDSSAQDIGYRFRTCRKFHRGVAVVEQLVGHQKTAWGLIAKSGEYLISPLYSGIGDFTDCCDVAPFSPRIEEIREGRNWGLINNKGEIKMQPSWSSTSDSFFEGLLVVKTQSNRIDSGWGLVDPTGQWSLAPIWEGLSDHVTERSIGAKKHGKWGVIDVNGKWIIEPKFDFCSAFHEGVARASIKNSNGLFKTGYIDVNGKWVIEPIYDDCGDFRSGLGVVAIFNEQTDSFRTGYVDKASAEYWEGS